MLSIQCFSNDVQMNHLGVLQICILSFSKSGIGPRFCISVNSQVLPVFLVPRPYLK